MGLPLPRLLELQLQVMAVLVARNQHLKPYNVSGTERSVRRAHTLNAVSQDAAQYANGDPTLIQSKRNSCMLQSLAS